MEVDVNDPNENQSGNMPSWVSLTYVLDLFIVVKSNKQIEIVHAKHLGEMLPRLVTFDVCFALLPHSRASITDPSYDVLITR